MRKLGLSWWRKKKVSTIKRGREMAWWLRASAVPPGKLLTTAPTWWLTVSYISDHIFYGL